ncbi:hypothetical protein Gogos_002511 [Gossypium gossypioides]|uniref:Uncharacterized protein n=1 Tax=Gossypium gossypioides TaxID=34282 RepID=A0A7J9CS17_GOSGO|nr:hypothetical protein [Gossypium gossypioides]
MTTCSMLTCQPPSVSGSVPDQILSNKFSASVRHCYSKRMVKVKLLRTLQQGMRILLL